MAFQFRRGLKAALDKTKILAGEPTYTTDSKEAFLGDGAGGAKEFMFVEDYAAAGGTGKVNRATSADSATPGSALESILLSGWIPLSSQLIFSSADSPEYTVTVSGDYHAIIYSGCRLMATVNGVVGYYIVVKSTYSAPNTSIALLSAITMSGNTVTADYPIASGNTITNVFYALPKTYPFGLPIDPNKWSVVVYDTTNPNVVAAQNTWYNVGSLKITVPIGLWKLSYSALVDAWASSGLAVITMVNLSTSATSSDDTYFISGARTTLGTEINGYVQKEKSISLSAKTNYFLIAAIQSANASGLAFAGSYSPTVLRAVCAYL